MNRVFNFYRDELVIDLKSLTKGSVIYIQEIDILNHNEFDYQYSAPTWEQVFKWFRERGYFTNIGYLVKYKKYYFDIVFERKEEFDKWNKYPQLNLDFNNSIDVEGEYNSYQECQENLVLKLIEIYKEYKNN